METDGGRANETAAKEERTRAAEMARRTDYLLATLPPVQCRVAVAAVADNWSRTYREPQTRWAYIWAECTNISAAFDLATQRITTPS